MKLTLIAAAALLSTSLAHAVLVQGTPSFGGGPSNMTPVFGTLINFDDVATGNPLVATHYAVDGVTSITNSLGPALGYYGSSQSGINYVGTGGGNGWAADILIEFTALQASVGLGIAGSTGLQFELLDASKNVLEDYSLNSPSNAYYYIDRPTADTKFLRVVGNHIAIDDLQFATGIPEPETYALMLAGLGVVGFMARRRKA